MVKTPFIYQRWFLRIFCAGIMLPIIMLVQNLFALLLGIEYANFRYIVICCIVALCDLAVYYKITQRHKWFERTGTYWVDNGIVYIQRRNKIYELRNIKRLRGTTVSAYGIAKSGMLIIESEKDKLFFVSSSTESVACFSKCDLFPLFEKILEWNPQLKKDDTLDFWYESRRN